MYFMRYLQAKEDGDKPGLEAMLQKVLQLYASKVLSKRSYAKKGNSSIHVVFFTSYSLCRTCIKARNMVWLLAGYVCMLMLVA